MIDIYFSEQTTSRIRKTSEDIRRLYSDGDRHRWYQNEHGYTVCMGKKKNALSELANKLKRKHDKEDKTA